VAPVTRSGAVEPVTVQYDSQLAVLASTELVAIPGAVPFVEPGFLAEQMRDLAKSPQHVGRAISVAMLLIQLGHNRQAVDVLNHFVRDDSDYWVDHYRAVALHRLGEQRAANELLRLLTTRCPDDPRPLHTLGRMLIERREWKDAVAALLRASELRDADAVLWSDLASAQMALGLVRDATRSVRRALRIDPRCALAANNMAICMWARGEHKRAESYLQAAFRLERRCLPIVHNLAECYLAQGIFDSAVQLLEGHIKDFPTDVSAMERLAWAHFHIQSLRRAIELLKQAARITNYKAPSVLNNLGIILDAKHDAVEAERVFGLAHALAPYETRGRVNFAIFRMRHGQWADVIRLLNPLPPLQDVQTSLLLASALTLERRAREAATLLEELAAVHPENNAVLSTLGFVYCSGLNQPARAVELLTEAHGRAPEEPVLANNLGYALLKVNDIVGARRVLGPFLVHLGELPAPVRVYLRASAGLLLIREGNFEGGLLMYQQALGEASGLAAERIRQKISVETARHFLRLGNMTLARRHLAAALEKDVDAEFTSEARQLEAAYSGPN
jgi:Flp pilus assembly protein TadD